jgi:hypothetical protein
LYAAGEIMPGQAVIDLLRDAEASGLVAEIGRAEVQRIVDAAFGWRHP